MKREDEIFKGKTFNDLMKDIYDNSKNKDRQITTLIAELRPLIKNAGDATIIVPLIKEYLEVAVKNDEHIVRLAAICQRLIATNKNNATGEVGGIGLTEEEKNQLLSELDEISSEVTNKKSDSTMGNLKERIDAIKDEMDDGDQ